MNEYRIPYTINGVKSSSTSLIVDIFNSSISLKNSSKPGISNSPYWDVICKSFSFASLISAAYIDTIGKVDEQGIKRIINKVKSGESIKTIVVVKHPEKEYFAVLDGHHRFWALKELGISTIKCAVVEDNIGLGFYLTKEGVFQPDPKITKYIRIPLKRFNQYMTWLSGFFN